MVKGLYIDQEVVGSIPGNPRCMSSWQVSHICWLMTFTLKPSSTIVPGIYLPLIITIITELLVSTTVGPSSGSRFSGVNTDLSPSINRGTNCNSRPNGNIIWHYVSACHALLDSPLSLPVDCRSSAIRLNLSGLLCFGCIILAFSNALLVSGSRWYSCSTSRFSIRRL